VEGNKVYPSELEGIEEGMIVYRNYDHKFAKTLQGNKTKRLINVKMQFEETENGFMLGILDEDGIEVSIAQKVEKVPAKNQSAAEETIRRQLTKLGDSIFVSEKLGISWSRPYFIPVSVCNKMRREAVSLLYEERSRRFPRRNMNIIPNDVSYPSAHLDYSANVANKKSETFYRRHRVKIIEPAFELLQNERAAVMTMKHCLRFQFGLCTGQGTADADLFFLQDGKNKYRLEFDCSACQMKIFFEEKK
jgi:putative protease